MNRNCFLRGEFLGGQDLTIPESLLWKSEQCWECEVEALLRLEPVRKPGNSLNQPTGLFLEAHSSKGDFWFKARHFDVGSELL